MSTPYVRLQDIQCEVPREAKGPHWALRGHGIVAVTQVTATNGDIDNLTVENHLCVNGSLEVHGDLIIKGKLIINGIDLTQLINPENRN